jgi:hypothetical protein
MTSSGGRRSPLWVPASVVALMAIIALSSAELTGSARAGALLVPAAAIAMLGRWPAASLGLCAATGVMVAPAMAGPVPPWSVASVQRCS